MKTPTAPANLTSLNARTRNEAAKRGLAEDRFRRSIAHTIVGQMLPQGVVKGGTAIRMRVPETEARFTRDLDFSPTAGTSPGAFIEEFADNLERGWADFQGRLVTKKPAAPPGVPMEYVMAPFEVKLSYKTKPWCTVIFELGHDEAGSTDGPELRIAEDLVSVFNDLGLPIPQPIPLMSVAQQAAQKLHACTSEAEPGGGNERAHDLVDLQILHRVESIDPAELNEAATRLFSYRKRQTWPPTVVSHPNWDTLYAAAADGLAVCPDLAKVVQWANDLVAAATGGLPAPSLPEPPEPAEA